jgi:hypothetical protein
MYGVIVVAPSPWYTKPSGDGSFSFTNVEPGRYHLLVWQKASGLMRKKVSVPNSGSLQITVSLPELSED